MNFSRPFIERPIGTTLLAMGLMLLGLVAYIFLPVASLPSVEFPTIRVNASLPGADPETMAARVAAPLERRLGEIAGVTEMTSTNSLGSTRIAIQFDLDAHIEGAAQDVQAAINAAAADLPADMPSLPHLPQVEPGGGADPDPGADLQVHSAERHVRRGRHRHRPAHLAGRRRGRGDGGRRRPARHPRARQPDAAGVDGPEHRGRAHGHHQCQCRGAARHHRRRPARDGAGNQRPAAHARGLPEHRGQVGERQCRAPVGGRQCRPGHAQLSLGRHVQRAAGHPADHRQERRRQCHRHGRPHPRADPGDQALDPGRHGHLHPVRPHHARSGPACSTCS